MRKAEPQLHKLLGWELICGDNSVDVRKSAAWSILPWAALGPGFGGVLLWLLYTLAFVDRGDLSPMGIIVAVAVLFAAIVFCWYLSLAVLRVALPWTAQIQNRDGNPVLSLNLFGFGIKLRRLASPLVVRVRPSYSRGDWGFQLYLMMRNGKEASLTIPTLCGANKSKAQSLGASMGGLIADCLRGKVEMVGWNGQSPHR